MRPVYDVRERQRRTPELDVEPEAEGMQPHLGGQARLVAREVMGPLVLQTEGRQQAVVVRLHDLADAGSAPHGLGPVVRSAALGLGDDVVAAAQQLVVLAGRRQRGAGAPQVLHRVAGEGPCGGALLPLTKERRRDPRAGRQAGGGAGPLWLALGGIVAPTSKPCAPYCHKVPAAMGFTRRHSAHGNAARSQFCGVYHTIAMVQRCVRPALEPVMRFGS